MEPVSGSERSPEGGSSVRFGNPWADPPEERDPLRQARGRLPAPVTVWTAGDAGDWAGLTVSSVLLAQGEPGRLVGLIGPDADLAGAIEQRGVFVVHLLADRADHRRLAQHFAGSLGAAGDLLEVEEGPYGPRLLAAPDQLDCRVTDRRATGWSDLVEADVDDIRLGPPRPGLLWYGGEFRRWA